MWKPFVAITSFSSSFFLFFFGGGGGSGGGEGVPGYVLSRFSFTATRRAVVTTDAEIMVPSLLRTHSYQNAFYFKPRVGQNIPLRASPTARIAPFLFSAFLVHSTLFSQSSSKQILQCSICVQR